MEPSSSPTHLLDVPPEGWSALPVLADQPRFRVEQVRRWVFERRATSFDLMSDLPKALRAKLGEALTLWRSEVAAHKTSRDGTEKLLLRLPGKRRADGTAGPPGEIECVLLRDGARRTICISSQVGCAMGCVFCASGLAGVERNLTTGEIVEQMLRLQHRLPEAERLSHIVVMGMGEPLANLDRLLPALDVASDERGLGISARRITISTVGLPPAMRRLTERDCRFHLAVSLHAPNDALRNQIVPTNPKTGLAEILSAADAYFEASGRRLTFEYVLLAGINDGVEHAAELARLLQHRTALLNVIPYNPVAGLPYKTPSPEAIRAFRQRLLVGGVNVQFRQRKGDEIDAACGQLRRNVAAQGVAAPTLVPTITS